MINTIVDQINSNIITIPTSINKEVRKKGKEPIFYIMIIGTISGKQIEIKLISFQNIQKFKYLKNNMLSTLKL